MDAGTLVKILVLFTAINVFVSVGIHATIVSNAQDVRDTALDYVNEYCGGFYDFSDDYGFVLLNITEEQLNVGVVVE